MPNPTFVKFAGEMEALFSQEKEIEHEEFFITDLKNVESGGNFPVFSSFWKLKEDYIDLGTSKGVPFFCYRFSSLTK
jgi:hypothetical protein